MRNSRDAREPPALTCPHVCCSTSLHRNLKSAVTPDSLRADQSLCPSAALLTLWCPTAKLQPFHTSSQTVTVQQVFLILTLWFRLHKHTFLHQRHFGFADFVYWCERFGLIICKRAKTPGAKAGRTSREGDPEKKGGGAGGKREGPGTHRRRSDRWGRRKESVRDDQNTKKTTRKSNPAHM